jgi:hypothetical protein
VKYLLGFNIFNQGGKLKVKLVISFLLLLLVVSVGCSSGTASTSTAPKTTTPPGKVPPASELAKQGFVSVDLPRISAEDLFVIYDNRDPLTLVDVRIKELFDTGYIPGARNISNEPKADSISKLTTLPKDRLIVVYCD